MKVVNIDVLFLIRKAKSMYFSRDITLKYQIKVDCLIGLLFVSVQITFIKNRY
jgi:hypothetical protein